MIFFTAAELLAALILLVFGRFFSNHSLHCRNDWSCEYIFFIDFNVFSLDSKQCCIFKLTLIALANLKKDLDTINDAAESFDAELPMAKIARKIYADATDAGFGDIDYTGIISYIRKLSKE